MYQQKNLLTKKENGRIKEVVTKIWSVEKSLHDLWIQIKHKIICKTTETTKLTQRYENKC